MDDGIRLSFAHLLNSNALSDITVYVGPDQVLFKLHKLVLCANSTFFKTACTSRFVEAQNNEVYLPEQKPRTFRKIVDFLYTGNYAFGEPHIIDHVDIFVTAVYLGIEDLRQLSMQKLWRGLQDMGTITLYTRDELVDTLDVLYSNSSVADRRFAVFREALTALTARFHIKRLLRNGEFQQVLIKHGELGLDLLTITHQAY